MKAVAPNEMKSIQGGVSIVISYGGGGTTAVGGGRNGSRRLRLG